MTEEPRYSGLVEFEERWLAFELPKKSIAPVSAALRRSASIEAEGTALAAAARATPIEIAARVVAGELSVEEGVAEATRAYAYQSPISQANPSSVAEALVVNARAQCHKSARTFLRQNAVALVDEAERKGVTDIRAMLEEYGYLQAPAEAPSQRQRVGVVGKATV